MVPSMGDLRKSVILGFMLSAAASHAAAQVTTRASVASGGFEANAASGSPVMTPDGRYVVFLSSATNLTPEATAGVFRHDRATGTTILIAHGLPFGFEPGSPDISDDGQTVIFTSRLDNLVPNDTNGVSDLFIWSATDTGYRPRPSCRARRLVRNPDG